MASAFHGSDFVLGNGREAAAEGRKVAGMKLVRMGAECGTNRQRSKSGEATEPRQNLEPQPGEIVGVGPNRQQIRSSRTQFSGFNRRFSVTHHGFTGDRCSGRMLRPYAGIPRFPDLNLSEELIDGPREADGSENRRETKIRAVDM
jgi:hypothetical protein